ncbi:MAG: Xaa-Pro peptidase family protein, partial [Candidatus Aminicenantes bacterium]|nr:Xaa-Pro peptidase family protein [Candidatus Aminicenantes bacterium]
LIRELQFARQLRERFPDLEVRDASPLLWELRMIKSPAEIVLLRRAARIGVLAHTALIQSSRPGVSEKELAAVFEYICKKEGASDLAYETILMSGKNHAYGHYHAHDRILEKGDFVILDAGPDFAYYHTDISSTFPASGRFSPEQRDLYEMGLAIREVCLETYRPGITFREVGEKIAARLRELGIDPDLPKLRGIILYGGYNHMIGLATHDPVTAFAGPDEKLKPGFVFACDINIPYPEKELGIRIEDTILITETGCKNLSNGLPRTVEEIESLMRKDGIIQVLKKLGKY